MTKRCLRVKDATNPSLLRAKQILESSVMRKIIDVMVIYCTGNVGHDHGESLEPETRVSISECTPRKKKT